ALHFYAATHKDDLRARMTRAVQGGLPVFVSEFGICDASGNGSIDKGSANAWVSAMNKLSVSWCMWSLCNKDESASILKSSCGASSGFKAGDLAASGKWLLDALGGKLSGGTSSTGGAPGSDTGSGTSSSGGSGSGSGASTTGGSGSSATASGKTTTFTCGKLSCKATLVNSWPAQSGKTCYQYDLTITNKGAARTSWSVSVPFNKKISFVNGWNGMYKATGSTLVIRSMDYNGTIAKGGTVSGVGFQVTSTAGLAVKK
ncbi:MAG: cellulose binding domain-containing protein, partial [Atopobiaceae bacterium]|nr:cellulose binding domain-containing protein [Atopobiaceae bacterium]